jgi:hypothetical protein
VGASASRGDSYRAVNSDRTGGQRADSAGILDF